MKEKIKKHLDSISRLIDAGLETGATLWQLAVHVETAVLRETGDTVTPEMRR